MNPPEPGGSVTTAAPAIRPAVRCRPSSYGNLRRHGGHEFGGHEFVASAQRRLAAAASAIDPLADLFDPKRAAPAASAAMTATRIAYFDT